MTDIFRRVGIVHIIVLSGYNITIVAEVLLYLFSFFSRKVAFGASATGIVFFALMTGASATVIRASIMALLVIVSRITYRKYDMPRALLLAGFGMVLHNPKILLFDPSFQLSFLATLGLIYGVPLIQRITTRIEEWGSVRQIIVETLATQLFVLPLLIFMSGQVSLVALFVNILVLWVVPYAMGVTLCIGLIGIFTYALAFPFAGVGYICAEYIFRIAQWFNTLPFASVSIPQFSAGVLVFIYILGAFLLYVYATRKEKEIMEKKE